MWFSFSNLHFQNDFDFKSPLFRWIDFDFKIVIIMMILPISVHMIELDMTSIYLG